MTDKPQLTDAQYVKYSVSALILFTIVILIPFIIVYDVQAWYLLQSTAIICIVLTFVLPLPVLFTVHTCDRQRLPLFVTMYLQYCFVSIIMIIFLFYEMYVSSCIGSYITLYIGVKDFVKKLIPN